MSVDYQFDDAPQRSTSTFDPEAGYVAFTNQYRGQLTYDLARTFFVKQKEAKAALSKSTKTVVTISFSGVAFDVVNNHNPQNSKTPVPDNSYTLHRISGYLARWVMEQSLDPLNIEEIQSTIVVPLAENKGCKWTHGTALYLSFCPGTEMFLRTFQFLPLAIEMQRVLKDDNDPTYMKKALRQKYGSKDAEQWMKTEVNAVKSALATVQKLPWAKAGFSPAARTFLAKFNITV
ncbi:nucleoprotein [Belmont virus]|nr:nucleoprotein [Belmont virus]